MPHDLAPPPPAQHLSAIGGHDFPYEVLLNNAIVGICFLENRRFIWTNPRLNQMFGYAHGELNGQSIRVIYASDAEFRRVGKLYPAMARDEGYVHELQLMRRNGEVFWCQLSGRLTDPNDLRSTGVWVLQDVSDRKRAEAELVRTNQQLEHTVERRTRSLQRTNEALRAEIERRHAAQLVANESREKYRSLFRHLPLGVLVADANGKAIEFNRTLQTWLGARSAAELLDLAQGPTHVVEGGASTSLSACLARHAPTGRKRLARFELSWRGRSHREFVIIASPRKGVTAGVTYTFTDVTAQLRAREREQAQQDALAHASRVSLMGQMATALAHELGQPLNACQSYILGLRLRLSAAAVELPDVNHAIEKITTHLNQAAAIIRNVRAFAARRRHKFDRRDLPDLLRKTLSLLEVQLRVAGVQPVFTADPDLPPAYCNTVEIQQVLINLVMNALEAMQQLPAGERRLTIHIGHDRQGMLAVTVADNGSGIPAELARQLFEPYFTTKEAGLGMGLMICRTIIESHGGSIRLLPSRHGTAFRFTLRAED